MCLKMRVAAKHKRFKVERFFSEWILGHIHWHPEMTSVGMDFSATCDARTRSWALHLGSFMEPVHNMFNQNSVKIHKLSECLKHSCN